MTVDIKIAVTKLGFVDAEETRAGTSYSDNDTALGLVSSHDGKSFYAPANLEGEQADYDDAAMSVVTTDDEWSNSNSHVGYMKYGIHVTAPHESGSGRTLKITLAKPTVVGNNLLASYRIAFGESAEGYASGNLNVYSNEQVSHSGYTSTTATGTPFNTTAFTDAGSQPFILEIIFPEIIDFSRKNQSFNPKSALSISE